MSPTIANSPMDGSLAACLAALAAGQLGYSRDHRRKCRNYLRRGVKLFYAPADDEVLETLLADIPATLEAFDAKWLRGKYIPKEAASFGSTKVYKDARRDCRRVIEVFTGEAERRAAERALQDGWYELDMALHAAIADGRVVLHEKKPIALTALMRHARRAGLHPHRITHDWLAQIVAGCDLGSEKKSLQRAALLLDSLRGQPGAVPPNLLPAQPLGKIHAVSKKRRKKTLPASLTGPLEDWLAKKQDGPTTGYQRRRGRGVTAETAKTYRTGCRWYIEALIIRGLIDPLEAPTPAQIAREDWLEDCVNAEIEALFPWHPLEPVGLLGYASDAAAWLSQYNNNLVGFQKYIIGRNRFFDEYNLISKKRRAWCRQFVSDIDMQITFFNLPLTFQRMAEPLLADYDRIGPVSQARAIKLAVAAAMAAILTSLPLRSSSLDALTALGPNPHVRLNDKNDPDRLWIFLPAQFVKNNEDINHPIRPKPPVYPRQIIEWFIADARERLLATHIYDSKADPLKLFCGVGYNRLHACWDFATTEAGIPMSQHLARHAIASWLYNIDRNAIELIAALLRITPATVVCNYAFIHQDLIAKESDDFLAEKIAALRETANKLQPRHRGVLK